MTFAEPRGFKGVVVGPIDNVANLFPKEVHVQYIPNGGATFQDFNLGGGQTLVRLIFGIVEICTITNNNGLHKLAVGMPQLVKKDETILSLVLRKIYIVNSKYIWLREIDDKTLVKHCSWLQKK